MVITSDLSLANPLLFVKASLSIYIKRSNHTSKEWWLRGHRRAERSYSMFKVRRGSREMIPLIQGKGAAAALCWSSCEKIPHVQGKGNSSKMVGVARGHQRSETLKP